MRQELRIRVRDIRVGPLLQTSGVLRAGVIVLAALLALASGMSELVYPSSYSPLIIGAVVAAAAGVTACFRKPIWALYAAVFVVLLPIGLIPPSIHSIINRAVTVLAVGAWLFDALTQRRRIHWTVSATLMMAFLAWSTASLIWAENLSRGMTLLQTYVLRFALFLFLIPNEIRTRQKLDGLMNTLALNGWILIAVSVGTVFAEGYQPGTRLQAAGMNENELGIIALLAMTAVLWQTMQPSKRYKALGTLLALVYVPLAVFLVAMSGSRGSTISLGVAFVAFCFWKPTRRWGLLGLLTFALGVAMAPVIFSTTLERFAVVRGDTMLGGREAIWRATSMLIADNPWGGVGVGNARYAVMPYLRPLRSVLGHDSASIHNPILTIYAEIGLPGLFLYLGVLASAVWSFVRQGLSSRRSGTGLLMPYYALVSSVFLGYMASWIKGGGMESEFSYFLMLALLLIPSRFCTDGSSRNQAADLQEVDRRTSRRQDAHPEQGLLS